MRELFEMLKMMYLCTYRCGKNLSFGFKLDRGYYFLLNIDIIYLINDKTIK